MKFVIFHGSYSDPSANWFPELKAKLTLLGEKVIVPQFPVDDWEKVTKRGIKNQSPIENLTNWLTIFEKEVLPTIINEKNLCFIGHSLGPLFILHVVEKFNIKLDSAIFVCPFLKKLNRSWQIDYVNQSFYKEEFNFRKLKKLIPVSYVLYSDNDPYVDEKYSLQFARKIKSKLILVKKGGHLNTEFGFTKFPLIFELCLKRLNEVKLSNNL